MKTIIATMLMLTSVVAAENEYLARSQLALHAFFYSKDKSVMKAYTTLAEIRNAIKKDDSIKDKKKLLEVVDMNKDIITTYRNSLEKKVDRKEKAPTKIDYTVADKTEEIGTKKNKIKGIECRVREKYSKDRIIVITRHFKGNCILVKGIIEVRMYRKYRYEKPHRTAFIKIKNLADRDDCLIDIKVREKYGKIEAVPVYVAWCLIER